MRLAVFTSQYPARVSTFFSRDMRSLSAAGASIDVFAVRPLESALWKFVPDSGAGEDPPRNRVHHLRIRECLSPGLSRLRADASTLALEAARILPSAARGGPRTLAKSAYVLPKAWAWAAEFPNRFDHILAYWGNYAATCAYLFHRLAAPEKPFSMFLHAGTDLYRRPVFLRQKLIYADNVIVVCEFNRGYLEQRFPDLGAQLERKVYVHHLGLDLAEFPPSAAERPPGRIVAVGSFEKVKGFDQLLRAAALVRARGTTVHIELIGEGPEGGALRRLAREVALGDAVSFRGWLPFEQVKESMRGAVMLVHPSVGLGDAVPTVIKEAMALGTPVIATRVAGIPELLDSGNAGVLVPPGDSAALAEAIHRLLGDPAERRRLAVRARQRAEAMFDQWRNGAALYRLLQGSERPSASTAAARERLRGTG